MSKCREESLKENCVLCDKCDDKGKCQKCKKHSMLLDGQCVCFSNYLYNAIEDSCTLKSALPVKNETNSPSINSNSTEVKTQVGVSVDIRNLNGTNLNNSTAIKSLQVSPIKGSDSKSLPTVIIKKAEIKGIKSNLTKNVNDTKVNLLNNSSQIKEVSVKESKIIDLNFTNNFNKTNIVKKNDTLKIKEIKLVKSNDNKLVNDSKITQLNDTKNGDQTQIIKTIEIVRIKDIKVIKNQSNIPNNTDTDSKVLTDGGKLNVFSLPKVETKMNATLTSNSTQITKFNSTTTLNTGNINKVGEKIIKKNYEISLIINKNLNNTGDGAKISKDVTRANGTNAVNKTENVTKKSEVISCVTVPKPPKIKKVDKQISLNPPAISLPVIVPPSPIEAPKPSIQTIANTQSVALDQDVDEIIDEKPVPSEDSQDSNTITKTKKLGKNNIRNLNIFIGNSNVQVLNKHIDN